MFDFILILFQNEISNNQNILFHLIQQRERER
jgi:hypothetical protein